jgi:hypothetical protein
VLELTIGGFLLVAAAVLAACRLRIAGAAPFALAVLTLAAALIVAATLALSAFGSYEPGAMLALQLAATIVIAAWWATGGRPRPDVRPLPSPAAVRAAALRHRTVAVLVVAAGVAALVELFLGLTVAPNTYDGLMYHLSRAAMWIQDGSVFGMDGGTIYETQHQPVGEFLYAWTMLLLEGDRFAALVQWLAALGCGLVVYEGARMIGYARSAAAFAAAVFLTMPQIVVQASSTFVDLPAALFVGAFAIFAIRWLRDRAAGDLVVAALALGLAVGTKGTAFLAAPALLLLIGAEIRRVRPSPGRLAAGAAVVAAGTLLLGGSKYIENAIETGSPQGVAGDDVTRTEPLPISAGRTLWTFVDVPGLDGTYVEEVLDDGSEYFFPAVDPGPGFVSEDYVAFGPVGWLVLLPLLAWFAVAPGRPASHRLLAWGAILYVAAHVLVVETYHFAPHTMITGVMIGAPLLAALARVGWVRHLIGLAAIVTLIPILVHNEKKPLWPEWSPGLDRAHQQALGTVYGDALAAATDALPEDARVLFIGPRVLAWDYPFFGPGLDRYVFRVDTTEHGEPTAAEVEEWVDRYDLDAIVWATPDPPPGAKRAGVIADTPTAIELLE